jgi:hypothetical protein
MGNIGYMSYGPRKLQIVKGSDLVSGNKQTAAYKVGDSFTCYSGEPIFAKKNTNGDLEWTKTAAAGNSAPFFAFTDTKSFDVAASGSLLGISVLDTFELQTAFYDKSATYTPGTALTVKTGGKLNNEADGGVTAGTEDDMGTINYVTVAKSNEPIVGYVTEGLIQLKNNQEVADTGANGVGLDGYIVTANDGKQTLVGGPALYTEASDTTYVLQFSTAWGSKA